MVSYTPMDLHKQVGLYNNKLNLNLDGKSIKECICIIQNTCPRLHSNDEIKEYAKHNLKLICDEFGFKALRIFYHSFIKQDMLKSFTGEDMLEMKYDKLIKDIKKYHDSLLDWIDLQLDYYVYCKELETIFKNEYGTIKDYNNSVYSIIKTIHLSRYNKEIISALSDLLKKHLIFSGDKYYLEQDLSDPEILDMLYEHITEEAWDESQYTGCNNMFVDFDGYGNEYYIHEYEESWEDENGWHCRSWNPEHTIKDYVRRG